MSRKKSCPIKLRRRVKRQNCLDLVSSANEGKQGPSIGALRFRFLQIKCPMEKANACTWLELDIYIYRLTKGSVWLHVNLCRCFWSHLDDELDGSNDTWRSLIRWTEIHSALKLKAERLVKFRRLRLERK